MEGRVFKIKKSILLIVSAFLFFSAFITLTLISIFVWKIADLWFYSFCLCLGIYELIKSNFFRLDSSLYIGTLLVFIGAFGYVFWFTKTISFAPLYILSAFASASIITFFKTGQKFHLIFAYSIIFVAIFVFLLLKSLISLHIFIAFVVPFLILLILEVVYFLKRRK